MHPEAKYTYKTFVDPGGKEYILRDYDEFGLPEAFIKANGLKPVEVENAVQ